MSNTEEKTRALEEENKRLLAENMRFRNQEEDSRKLFDERHPKAEAFIKVVERRTEFLNTEQSDHDKLMFILDISKIIRDWEAVVKAEQASGVSVYAIDQGSKKKDAHSLNRHR